MAPFSETHCAINKVQSGKALGIENEAHRVNTQHEKEKSNESEERKAGAGNVDHQRVVAGRSKPTGQRATRTTSAGAAGAAAQATARSPAPARTPTAGARAAAPARAATRTTTTRGPT